MHEQNEFLWDCHYFVHCWINFTVMICTRMDFWMISSETCSWMTPDVVFCEAAPLIAGTSIIWKQYCYERAEILSDAVSYERLNSIRCVYARFYISKCFPECHFWLCKWSVMSSWPPSVLCFHLWDPCAVIFSAPRFGIRRGARLKQQALNEMSCWIYASLHLGSRRDPAGHASEPRSDWPLWNGVWWCVRLSQGSEVSETNALSSLAVSHRSEDERTGTDRDLRAGSTGELCVREENTASR